MRPHSFVALGAWLIAGATPLLAQATSASPQRRSDRAIAADTLPSVQLPPALDRVLRDYERAWRARDAAALAALFAEDGFVLQSGRPPIRGRPAIEAVYAGQGGGMLRLRALAYGTQDSVGFIIGGYRYEDGGADVGKFTLTLRRTARGPWMIFSDMDNPNQPPRLPRPATTTPDTAERR